MSSLLAAIDLGTNTARLLIGSTDGKSVVPVVLERRITRLGGGFTKETGISSAAWQRSLAALSDFAAAMKQAGVERLRAVATSAVRDAANGQDFRDDVRKKTGIRLETIDGREEGLLTLNGVISALDPKPAPLFVFDVGGGSTEYTLAEGEKPLFTQSLPLGVVRLTEGKSAHVEAMIEKIERELIALKQQLATRELLASLANATLVGTAGTATTLAAISRKMTTYDYRLINNTILSREEITDIYEMLLPLSPQQRLAIPGMEQGREDLIIAGTLLTLKTMEIFGFTRLTISDFGLLEGVLLSMAKEG